MKRTPKEQQSLNADEQTPISLRQDHVIRTPDQGEPVGCSSEVPDGIDELACRSFMR
jgi:hypothetical protein